MRFGIVRALALLVLAGCRAGDSGEPKPDLYVLTSLPLLFDEGFELGPAKSEAAVYLRDHYRLHPIDLPSQLPPGATLLAGQPRALPAEELVALDAWVRAGGHVILLADPMLEWPSKRPFGNRMRPPMAFPDTGLLAHWGLRLDAPEEGADRLRDDGEVQFLSPGHLVDLGKDCRADGIEAACTIGKGKVLVVADADFLNVEEVRKIGREPTSNLPIIGNYMVAVGG